MIKLNAILIIKKQNGIWFDTSSSSPQGGGRIVPCGESYTDMPGKSGNPKISGSVWAYWSDKSDIFTENTNAHEFTLIIEKEI